MWHPELVVQLVHVYDKSALMYGVIIFRRLPDIVLGVAMDVPPNPWLLMEDAQLMTFAQTMRRFLQ